MVRHNKTQKSHSKLPEHIGTFHGVHDWFKHNYEHLGWMVLAKAKGYDFKIVPYKKSIEHLVATIENLMTEYKDSDRLHDLKVLHMETMCLHDFVKKNL
jgi:hypothetical protein